MIMIKVKQVIVINKTMKQVIMIMIKNVLDMMIVIMKEYKVMIV